MARIRVQIHEGLTGADRDGEAARRANAIAPSIAYALREGRVVTIEDSAPHANQKIGGVSPPLDIEEVRTLRSHAADCLSKKNKRVLIDPARVVQLCDAIERGYVIVDDMSRPAPRPTGFREWHAGAFPPGPKNERCTTAPVTDDDIDAKHDQQLAALSVTGAPDQRALAGLFGLCPAIARRRNHWMRMHAAAKRRIAEVEGHCQVLADSYRSQEAKNRGLVARAMEAERKASELTAEKARLLLRAESAEAGASIVLADNQRRQSTISDLLKSIDELTAGLTAARERDPLAGGVTEKVWSVDSSLLNPDCARVMLTVNTTVGRRIPRDAKFVTFWREDPRKAATK